MNQIFSLAGEIKSDLGFRGIVGQSAALRRDCISSEISVALSD